jgi:hypothetical protein
MRVNVYAEENDPLVENFQHNPVGQVVEKIVDGVPYYGMQIGNAEYQGVTYWFTSVENMRRFFVSLTEVMP